MSSTISDAITMDHRELEDYYNQVVSSKDLDKQQRFGNQFIWELAHYPWARNLLFTPGLKRYIGGDEGRAMAEHDR